MNIVYVDLTYPAMRLARAYAGVSCERRKVGAVLVASSGEIVGTGYNGGEGHVDVCPRVTANCPSGVGYERCSVCAPPNHAEAMALREAGARAEGATMVVYGHYWICDACFDACVQAGVTTVALMQGE